MERSSPRSRAQARLQRVGSAAPTLRTCDLVASASRHRTHPGAGGELSEQRWQVLHDGDCGLCKWLLCGLLAWDRRRRLHPLALQQPESQKRLADLAPQERMASWHLISPEGARQSGGAALPPLLDLLPSGRFPAAAFARLPMLTDRVYRRVAGHRSQLSKLIPARAKERAHECVARREREIEIEL